MQKKARDGVCATVSRFWYSYFRRLLLSFSFVVLVLVLVLSIVVSARGRGLNRYGTSIVGRHTVVPLETLLIGNIGRPADFAVQSDLLCGDDSDFR